MGTKFKGTIGKDVMASSWRGKPYIKSYTKPKDPKSELQLKHRAIVAEAVMTWKNLTASQKQFYTRMSDGLPGYQFFVSLYVKKMEAGQQLRLPLRIRWVRENGMPTDDVALIVRHRKKSLFTRSLKDAGGEMALDPSSSPYSLMLVKGAKTETVMVLTDLNDDSIFDALCSDKFGIKLSLAVVRLES